MNSGYKAFIAITLATVAIVKSKAQTDSFENSKDSICLTSALVKHPDIEKAAQDTTVTVSSEDFAEFLMNKDNKAQEETETPWKDTPAGKEIIATWERISKQDGNYSEITEEDIANLREVDNTSHLATALAEGLKNYVMDGEDMLRSNTDSLGLELERSAKMEANGPGGKCYKWIKHILSGTNPIAWLDGNSAYEAEKYLDKSPNVVKTKTIFKNMDKLIPGGIAVFGRGPGAFDGHILIGGKGPLNQVKSYITDWGREYLYNPARDISDVNRNANTSGTRNRGRGHYNPEPRIYYTANSTVSSVTILKIGYQYAKEKMSRLFVSTKDVFDAVMQINQKSAELWANKILKEKEKIDGFNQAKGQTAYYEYPATRPANPRGVRYTKAKTPTTLPLINRARGGNRRM